MKNFIFVLLLAIFILAFPQFSRAGDFYVVTATEKSQKPAQEKAAVFGGWVLNTNFYPKMTPNLFSVVRGPYKTKEAAEKFLKVLDPKDKTSPYYGSYVKDAGKINIQLKLGNKNLSPQMIAAILGEIRIDVDEEKGGDNPCEEGEPYKNITLSFVSITRGEDHINPEEVTLEVGSFTESIRTGEVDRMRACFE